MAKMSEGRRGQIALAIVEAQITSRGIPARRELMRQIDEAHKATGISKEELMSFFVACVPQAVSQILGVKNVQIMD